MPSLSDVTFRTQWVVGRYPMVYIDEISPEPSRVSLKPLAGMLIEFEGMSCVVVYSDASSVYISPLGVPAYYCFSHHRFAGNWKESEVCHA